MTSTHLGPAHTQSKSREQLWELIQDVRFAMFTTRTSAGELCSRPMTIQNHHLDEDNCLWFFMSRGGEPLAEIGHDCNVNPLSQNSCRTLKMRMIRTKATVYETKKLFN
jgi:general stress protein 26